MRVDMVLFLRVGSGDRESVARIPVCSTLARSRAKIWPMHENPQLRRELGVFAATGLGLGSILGTGVFVGLGLCAGVAGPGALLAVALAGLLAVANGISSAQLAAVHPVSGGTYEYGYRELAPWVGFVAGVTFLLAKSASAATAGLAIAGHALAALGLEAAVARSLAALLVLALTTWVASRGVRLGARVNFGLVTFTAAVLVVVAVTALARRGISGLTAASAWQGVTAGEVLQATALAFVAFTGYGRIATLGEEVREPRRTIPRAIGLALLVSLVLYALVAVGGLAALGAEGYHAATVATGAPLEAVADAVGPSWLRYLVAAAALTSMAAVLLNLLLGLSRVVLAMARRGDLPAGLARIDPTQATPRRATVAVALLIGAICALGSLSLAWSFSAFTVLIYYAITNLAALRLSAAQRFAPRWVSVVGLAGCGLIAAFVDPAFVGAGLLAVAAALGLRLWLRGSDR
jgi:APA family basic amino acid/polyamine antiporter